MENEDRHVPVTVMLRPSTKSLIDNLLKSGCNVSAEIDDFIVKLSTEREHGTSSPRDQ